jgi:hypothetical protein
VAEIDGGVFPQRAHLVDQRNSGASGRPERGQADQDGRMGMHDVRPLGRDHLGDAPAQGAHFQQLAANRQPGERRIRLGRAVKIPTVDGLARRRAYVVARRGDVRGLPAEAALRL